MGNFMRILTNEDKQILINIKAIAYLKIVDSVRGGKILSASLVNGEVIFIKEILKESEESISEFAESRNN